MKFVWALLLLSVLSCGLVAQDQSAPAEPDITFPDVSPPSPPAPPPVPSGMPVKLPYDTFYVITSNAPCLVVASPEGLVNVLEEKGPIKILGRFVEGKTQVRNYTKPYIFVVTAVEGASGVCELIVRAEGPKPYPIHRHKVEVGQGPRPPPVPPQPPTPVPPSDPFLSALQIAYAAELAPDKAKQVSVLANFYRSASQLTVNDPGLKTLGDLQDTLKVAVKRIGLPPGSLSRLIPVIAADEKRALGENYPAPLDPQMRAAAAAEYARVANSLEALK